MERQASESVRSVLDTAVVLPAEGLVRLDGQLGRDEYLAVNKVLEALGGKWDRKLRAHVFGFDPTEAIEGVVLTGSYERRQSVTQFFETPEEVGRRMIDSLDLTRQSRVLEPSAGRGALLRLALAVVDSVVAVEMDHAHANALLDLLTGPDGEVRGPLIRFDFLTLDPTPVFDAVLMNPPFARQQDIDHVRHAYEFLKPGGRIAAVMSAGVTFRTNAQAVDFRGWCDEAFTRGNIESLPPGSFRASGTDVATVLLTGEKRP